MTVDEIVDETYSVLDTEGLRGFQYPVESTVDSRPLKSPSNVFKKERLSKMYREQKVRSLTRV